MESDGGKHDLGHLSSDVNEEPKRGQWSRFIETSKQRNTWWRGCCNGYGDNARRGPCCRFRETKIQIEEPDAIVIPFCN